MDLRASRNETQHAIGSAEIPGFEFAGSYLPHSWPGSAGPRVPPFPAPPRNASGPVRCRPGRRRGVRGLRVLGIDPGGAAQVVESPQAAALLAEEAPPGPQADFQGGRGPALRACLGPPPSRGSPGWPTGCSASTVSRPRKRRRGCRERGGRWRHTREVALEAGG